MYKKRKKISSEVFSTYTTTSVIKMIFPIKNISHKFLNFHAPKRKQVLFDYSNETGISSGNIDYRAYLPNISSFDDTLKNNYFRLPKLTLADGTIVQAQPDKSQLECARKLYRGDSVLYCAPTGTGKTAVAHYIISKNLSENKETIYTTPLKALANDKLREFRKIYGEDKVGLLTGDIKINTSAPIKIMTTEIYNNQISGIKENPKNLRTIIFDEAHYLGDSDRGSVWENAIANTPFDKIQTLMLSATIGNSDDVTGWVTSLSPTRDVSKVEVPASDRFVPLVYYIHEADYHKDKMSKGTFQSVRGGIIQLGNYDELSERQKRGLEVFYKETNNLGEYEKLKEDDYKSAFYTLKNLFLTDEYDTQDFTKILAEHYPDINKDKLTEISELLAELSAFKIKRLHVKNYENNNYPALVNDLKENNMLPALIFKLSKNGAGQVCKDLKEAEIDLTSDEEKSKISEIIEEYRKNGAYLGDNFDKKMLLSGYAYHHAGELPQYKKLIEELFSKKLLKVVSATSTLSAGINMPAKTVVITGTSYKIYNPLTDELEAVEISANDFHQMTGRAGRRGIDSIGNVVFYNLQTPVYGFKNLQADASSNKSKYKELELSRPDELQIAYNLLESGADNLRSQFKPDWQALAVYYGKNSDDKALKDSIKNYFKYYLSKNKDKEEKSMMNKFLGYKTVLQKLGFIELNHKKEVSLTPKGKILTMSQGINPLMLANLLYNEAFKDLEPEEICQILGYIAGSANKPEDENLASIVNERMQSILKYDPEGERILEKFNKIKDNYFNAEDKTLKAQKESRIPIEDIMQSESFSGFCAFMFAYLNDKEINTVNNFRKISQANKLNLSKNNDETKSRAIDEFVIKSSEGNTYKILSQVVSILNQITRTCDYALSDPKDFKNTEYWKNLKDKAETAILLTKQNPIWDTEVL